MRRKLSGIRLDVAAWWVGIVGLAAVVTVDLVAWLTGWLPPVPPQIRPDLLAAATTTAITSAIIRWMIAPLREVFLHGWHARGEHDAKQRATDGDAAQVRYLPSSVFASSLAPAVPDVPAPRHRGPSRHRPR